MAAKHWFYERNEHDNGTHALTLASVMTKPVRTLTPEALVMDAMQLIREHGVRHIPIVDENSGKLVGLVTETDLLKNVLHGKSMTPDEQYHATLDMLLPLREVMVTHVQALRPEANVEKAIALFLKKKYRCVPVADSKGRLLGIVTHTDLLRLLEHVVEQ
ncbi:MAG: CBS domain-containing protein [Candidatus Lambdaproteobacteria bacterium]|nr:CBS domain-containing protein [Candidatus Lambdaproteobacteria bacterium]